MTYTPGLSLDDLLRELQNEIMSETWGADGKEIPLEEIIALTTKLICEGLNSRYSYWPK